MKAYCSSSTEIEIDLNKNDFSKLEKGLTGIITVRDNIRNKKTEKSLELNISKRDTDKWLELKSLPQGACFEDIQKYVVNIFPLGYEELKQYGHTEDRFGIAKVIVTRDIN